MARRAVIFTKDERARLADVCKAIGTTFEELVHVATMHALDELEGDENYRTTLWERMTKATRKEDRTMRNDEMCCEPDFDYENGHYIHEKRCWGSVEANEERDEETRLGS
jgi:hypothetical protein